MRKLQFTDCRSNNSGKGFVGRSNYCQLGQVATYMYKKNTCNVMHACVFTVYIHVNII